MIPFVHIEDGVDVKTLYPEANKNSKQKWECGNCGEENRGHKSNPVKE